MKTKFFILAFLGIAMLSGCNDTLTQVGTSIQPETDRPRVAVDTFYMQARTVQTDSVYARTIYGALGEIYDPLYGNLKSDFMCQFYGPENFLLGADCTLSTDIDRSRIRAVAQALRQ